MGANQSSAETRSVSMDNPTPAGVIDVSNEVVQRLKLGISRAKQEKKEPNKSETTHAVPVTEQKKATTAAPTPVTPKPAAASPPPTYSNSSPPQSTTSAAMSQFPRLVGEPTITAMEMRRQKEIELLENDEMWRTRMAQLEQNLNKTNAVIEKEYAAAAEDVRKRFAHASGTRKLPPCQDLKSQIIACYRAYPGESLKCAEEVEMFRNCVAVHRIKCLDSVQKAPAKAKQEKKEPNKSETTHAVPVTEQKKATTAAPTPVTPKPAAAPPPPTYSNSSPPQSTTSAAMSQFPRLVGEPTITAMEMRRQKEIELLENDEMWRTRMAQLEQNLNKTNAVIEKEYAAAAEGVRKRFAHASGTRKLPPCQDLKSQIIACYRAYPGESLKCAEEVEMFRNCVAVHRIKCLDSVQKAPAKGA